MVKPRPVVIISPRSRHYNLVTVVAMSTSAPKVLCPWHYNIMLDKPLSPDWPELSVWIKCDMLNTFSINRLDRFHARINNKRKYYDRRVSDKDLAGIRQSIACFLSI